MSKIQVFDGDISRLVQVAESWASECNGEEMGIDIDVAVFLEKLAEFARGPDSELFVIENDEIVFGILGMEIFDSPVGKQRICNEHFWYVIPEYRGASSIRLLRHGMKWAKEKGCSHIMLNASRLASNLHDEVCRLYERIGFKEFETVYVKKIL